MNHFKMGNLVDCLIDGLELCVDDCGRACKDECTRMEKNHQLQQHNFVTPTAHEMTNNIASDDFTKSTDDSFEQFTVQNGDDIFKQFNPVQNTNDIFKQFNPVQNTNTSSNNLVQNTSDNISPNTSDKSTVYILQLAEGKYYVGKTKDLDKRYQQHLAGLGTGSHWTTKYKPIRIQEFYPNKDGFDEDLHTKKYMAKYGIDNVRGGAYCQITLSKEVKEFIKNQIYGGEDHCYKCSQKGHYSNKCFK